MMIAQSKSYTIRWINLPGRLSSRMDKLAASSRRSTAICCHVSEPRINGGDHMSAVKKCKLFSFETGCQAGKLATISLFTGIAGLELGLSQSGDPVLKFKVASNSFVPEILRTILLSILNDCFWLQLAMTQH